MNKINILDSSIYNLISAGEVAVNPAGVVKELVENSLDAKATKITVEIYGGGKERIKVVDNGIGIDKSQVRIAFMPHTTSKISKVEDIYNISTLGFRGEALSSICNVSKLSITTRTEEEDVGVQLQIDAGKVVSELEKASNVGTEIIVSNLFYNTPARFKFLGTDKAEQREITKVMENLMLANHGVEFSYYIEGKLFVKTSGGSLVKTITEIQGLDFLNKAFPIEAEDGKYKLYGYAIMPNEEMTTRFNRCFVNGRITNNHCITSAIQAFYADYAMRNTQPNFIVFFELPYDEVDVNITPQKTDVKFQNDQSIYSWIVNKTRESYLNYLALERRMDFDIALEKELKKKLRTEDENGNVILKDEEDESIVKRPEVDDYKVIEIMSRDEANKDLDNEEFIIKYKEAKKQEEERLIREEKERIALEEKRAKQIEIFSFNNPQIDENDENKVDELNSQSEILQAVKNYRNSDYYKVTQSITPFNSVKQELTQMSFLKNKYKVLGVIFSTYVLVQMEDAFVIIDQHAAHERFLFDNYMDEIEKQEIVLQDLLLPYTIIADNDKANFLDANIDELNKLGFRMETFGNNYYKVETVPMILSDIDLDYFFDTIYANKAYLTNTDGQLKEKIAMRACKSAIKAGMTLSDKEIDSLIEMVKNTKSPLLCPHGRPYCLKILKSDIEKWFKRIV